MSAYEAVAEAQRALAQAQGLDYAIRFDVGCDPEAAASSPVLLQTDDDTFLTFNAIKKGPDGMRNAAGTAVVEVKRCHLTRFGYPNDEALHGTRWRSLSRQD